MNCKKCGFNNPKESLKCNQCGESLSSNNSFMKIIIAAGIIITIILTIPFIISKILDSKLNEHKINLKEIGIEATTDYSSGYFKINKKLSFKVNNGRYLATHISKILKEKYPDKKSSIDMILYEKEFDWESLLNGVLVTGELNLNAYLLEDPTLNITLKELSIDTMRDIKNDREASKILLPWLDKGILSSTIIYNESSELKGVKFKDIDENIYENGTRINFQLLSPSYVLENYKELYHLSRFYFNLKEENSMFNFQLDNISALNESKDELNTNYELNIDELQLLVNKASNIKLKTGKLQSKASTKDLLEKVSSSNDFTLNNIEFAIDKEKFDLNKFLMNLSIDNIDKKTLLTIIDDYSKNNFDFDEYTQAEFDNIFALLNKGMTLRFETKLDGFSMDKIKSSDLSLLINFKVLENSLNINTIANDFVKNIEVTAELKIDKKVFQAFSENAELLKKYIDLAQDKENFYIYNLNIKNSEITINDVNYNLISEMIGDFHFELKNYEKAINFYKQAVNNGNEYAKFRLAFSYAAIGLNDEALRLYKEFNIKYDDSVAMGNIALIYYDRNDHKNSVLWAEKSLIKGNAYDFFTLAYSYDMLGDYENAKKYYEKSIEKDKDVISIWNLGLIYEFGKGKIAKDEKKAFELYLEAANKGYENAVKKVAYMYRYGIGVKKDISKANYWQGNKQVEEKIERLDSSKTIKEEFFENGIKVKIEYPESIVSDSIVTIKLSMTNELPFAKSAGGISLSFPQLPAIGIFDAGSSTVEAKEYPANSKLWNGNDKKTIISEYALYEGWAKEWKKSETKTMNLSFYFSADDEMDDLNILVRSVIVNNKIEYVNPKEGVEGQQGYQNISIDIPIIDYHQ